MKGQERDNQVVKGQEREQGLQTSETGSPIRGGSEQIHIPCRRQRELHGGTSKHGAGVGG